MSISKDIIKQCLMTTQEVWQQGLWRSCFHRRKNEIRALLITHWQGSSLI